MDVWIVICMNWSGLRVT